MEEGAPERREDRKESAWQSASQQHRVRLELASARVASERGTGGSQAARYSRVGPPVDKWHDPSDNAAVPTLQGADGHGVGADVCAGVRPRVGTGVLSVEYAPASRGSCQLSTGGPTRLALKLPPSHRPSNARARPHARVQAARCLKSRRSWRKFNTGGYTMNALKVFPLAWMPERSPSEKRPDGRATEPFLQDQR